MCIAMLCVCLEHQIERRCNLQTWIRNNSCIIVIILFAVIFVLFAIITPWNMVRISIHLVNNILLCNYTDTVHMLAYVAIMFFMSRKSLMLYAHTYVHRYIYKLAIGLGYYQ